MATFADALADMLCAYLDRLGSRDRTGAPP
jgi:hypothetical protein